MSQTQEDLETRFFGKGFRLVQISPDSLGVDLAWDEAEGSRRLAMASGGDNLGQDLKIALLTATGSDVFNVAFGFDGLRVLTDNSTPQMTEEMLRLSVIKTVVLDARIKRVFEVRLTESGPGTRQWTAAVEVQTILGDVLELVLGDVAGR